MDPTIPVLYISAKSGDGVDQVAETIATDDTVVLLGSSGAGKSTLTNRLLERDIQKISTVREADNRGRHTTTSRQLFTLPGGGFLIDTPGMRELGIIERDTQAEQQVFNTIEQLSLTCKFRNCDHEKSDGCAVLAAIETGELSEREWHNYHKLLKEKWYNESKDVSVRDKYHAQISKRKKRQQSINNKKRLSRQ
jgi:ribosome biogenesis GTPase